MEFTNGRNILFIQDYQDVHMALKALEIVYHANGAVFEGLSDINGDKKRRWAKGKVSVGVLHKPKVRVAKANSPKYVLLQ